MAGSYASARRMRRIAVIGGVFGGIFLAALIFVLALVLNSDIICFSALAVLLVSFIGGVVWAVSLQQKQGSYALREVAEQLGLSASGDCFEGIVDGAPVRVSAYVHRSSSRSRDTRILLQVFHPRALGLDLSIRGRVLRNSPRPGTQELRFGHPELDSWLYVDGGNPQQAQRLLTPAVAQAIHWLVSWSSGRAWFELDEQAVQLDFHLDQASPEQVVEGAGRLMALRETIFSGQQHSVPHA